MRVHFFSPSLPRGMGPTASLALESRPHTPEQPRRPGKLQPRETQAARKTLSMLSSPVPPSLGAPPSLRSAAGAMPRASSRLKRKPTQHSESDLEQLDDDLNSNTSIPDDEMHSEQHSHTSEDEHQNQDETTEQSDNNTESDIDAATDNDDTHELAQPQSQYQQQDDQDDDTKLQSQQALPVPQWSIFRFKLCGVSSGGPTSPSFPLTGQAAVAAARAAAAEAKAAEQLERRRAEFGEAAAYVVGAHKPSRTIPVKQFWEAVDEHLQPLPTADPMPLPPPPPPRPLLLDRLLAALLPELDESEQVESKQVESQQLDSQHEEVPSSLITSVAKLSDTDLEAVDRRLHATLQLLQIVQPGQPRNVDLVAEEISRSSSRLLELSRITCKKFTNLRLRAHASHAMEHRAKMNTAASIRVRKRFARLKKDAAPPPIRKPQAPRRMNQR